MRIDRRKLLRGLPLAAALLVAPPPASVRAEEAFIPRIGGEVTPQNFGDLANLAAQSVDGIIGLKISIPEGEHDGLVAEEADGLLTVQMRKGDVALAFPSGYRKDLGRFFFDGYFSATSAGTHQGINAIHLAPARTMDVDATGKPVKEFAIGELPIGPKGG